VALYPYELVTYGETGQVCQNWMQYRLICRYLEILDENGTLVVESGHPLGIFASHPYAPRAIVTNGLMVGMFDNPKDFNIAAAMGVANYGQMTAGGWMYIGPQGIVHGTYNTILNAGRLKLGVPKDGNLAGKLFVSSGLGGMSGAQGKAAVIAGAASIIAEVDRSRIETRLSQGWVSCETASLGCPRDGFPAKPRRSTRPWLSRSPRATGESRSPSPTTAMSWTCSNTWMPRMCGLISSPIRRAAMCPTTEDTVLRA